MSTQKEDAFDREVALTRKNKKFMRLLDQRGREKASIPVAEARRRAGLPARGGVHIADLTRRAADVA